MTKVLLIGSTGLVGSHVLKQALDHPVISRVVALTRRALPAHPKLENPIIDFDHLPEDAGWWQVDSVICTLGTTMRNAGSKEAFRKVDFDYTLVVAKIAKKYNVRAYALNSALGANPESSVFYSKTKGEVEVEIEKIGFPSLTIVRPGLIAGDRTEFRFGERLALVATGILKPLLPRRYRAVPAERIANVLLNAAISAQPGKTIIESELI